jgi:formylglycine-generating enzyme required for sulfatase activity
MAPDRHRVAEETTDPDSTLTASGYVSDVDSADAPRAAGAADRPTSGTASIDAEGRASGEAPVDEATLTGGMATVERTLPPGAVEAVWGDDLDGVSPGMTLKGPGKVRPTAAGMSFTSPADVPPSVSIEGYELLDMLGQGGVGVVYQAVQKSIDRKIAVKMIKSDVGRDTGQRDKFISEAVVTGGLDHPNIVPIHDLGTTKEGQPFYTMKMVRGTPWTDVIDEASLSENLRILLDVCDAVSFAHSKDVVHRDLKPDNVMLGEFGEVQVMDWGLAARVSHDGELSRIPREQAIGGTPAYMAPEMVTGEDGPVGVHSDIYLLGAVLYRVVTGKPPHAGKRALDCLENARNNVIQPTECSGALADIALEAMRTDPRDRYASVGDLKQALLDCQAHAASISLCQRASSDLRQARDTRDYDLFAQALFGFREALRLWEDNADAKTGVADTQAHYARCAFEKGDLDLAASTLDRGCAAHQGLAAEIAAARRKRDAAKRRLKLFRAAAVSLTVAVILILTVASIWIYHAKQQAVAAKEAAVTAQQAESEQRKLAEAAKTKAQQEEARAVQALADLEKAYDDLVKAQEQERRATARAEASEQVATETRDELAKTGMLLDNSWWVFDAETARQKQEQAAMATGMPAELTLALSDDVKLELVLIPPGDFVMGSPPKEEQRTADEHLHRVRHTQTFYLGKFELTQGQWQALTGCPSTGDAAGDTVPTLPVINVSIRQITEELLPALQKHAPDGHEFRLPSEAEWEYACRAGTGSAYHSGDGQDALDSAGWFLSNSDRKVHVVGGKTPNAWGLYDMHGNAAEICTDEYVTAFYLESPTTDPIATAGGERHVVRGGSVLNTAEHCRSAYRSYVFQKNKYGFLGLRLALAPLRNDTAAVDTGQAGSGSAQP